MTRALLLFDEGPESGLGHRRRMTALATALEQTGAHVTIAAIPFAHDNTADVIVVDSYRIDAARTAQSHARLVAIDDLERDLDVHLLVDPSPGARVGATARADRFLSGPAFALIDPDLEQLRSPREPSNEPCLEVLIAAGGADRTGVGHQVASEIIALDASLHVRVACGPWGRSDLPAGADPVITTSGLGPHLAASDVVVTGAGVTLIEALALGRPTVTMVLAENQRRAATGFASTGATTLASDPVEAARIAVRLCRNPSERQALATHARSAVDFDGPKRIAEAIHDLG